MFTLTQLRALGLAIVWMWTHLWVLPFWRHVGSSYIETKGSCFVLATQCKLPILATISSQGEDDVVQDYVGLTRRVCPCSGDHHIQVNVLWNGVEPAQLDVYLVCSKETILGNWIQAEDEHNPDMLWSTCGGHARWNNEVLHYYVYGLLQQYHWCVLCRPGDKSLEIVTPKSRHIWPPWCRHS